MASDPVKIGYYGPADAEHPVGGAAWLGAMLAVEEANAGGGYEGRPFVIVQEWDENPWSGGAAGVVRMAYEERVAGIIGSINGDATHLAEQVVAKALLPLVDPLSTDRSVNAAFVPWMFSVMPDDAALMEPLAAALSDEPFVLISSVRHDPRLTTGEFLKQLGQRRPLRHIQFERPEGIAEDVARLGCDTAVILAGAADSARLVRDLKSLRPGLRIYGGHLMASRTFLREAGDAAEGVVFSLPAQIPEDFSRRFRERFGQEPDFAAVSTYDATMLLISAIREAGEDRAAVRDALEAVSPVEGNAGRIEWDTIRRNARRCTLATVRDGMIVRHEDTAK